MKPTVGVLHPGMMGATVAAAAAANGHQVLWASEGRSAATITRAAAAGITDATTLEHLAHDADVIVSVVPPSSALHVAELVAATGFSGIYVDANAVSPQRLERIADAVAGAEFVDGGVIGPPAHEPGTTRLYLSGGAAALIASIFASSPLEPIVVGDSAGAASALKMAYAAYTKGTAALVMAIRALAEHHHVSEPLLAEWHMSQGDLAERSNQMLARAPRKAWRFAGEMEEIAGTFSGAGLPAGFHEAAAEIFSRIGSQSDDIDPAEAIRRLL